MLTLKEDRAVLYSLLPISSIYKTAPQAQVVHSLVPFSWSPYLLFLCKGEHRL
jgi:hypothetical protein